VDKYAELYFALYPKEYQNIATPNHTLKKTN